MKKSLVLIFLFWAAALVFAQNPDAVFRETAGTVELKKAGATEWIPAKAGDRIEEETIISTGFKSMAIISVGNSTLSVRALTRMSLKDLKTLDETETVSINLNTGRVRAEVNPPSGSKANFTIQTPSVTASVRGTVFDLDPVSIQVIEGTVNYAPSGAAAVRPVTVNAGQESWVDDTGKAVNPVNAADANRSLPSLAGQSASSGSGGGARYESPRGSLVIPVIELIPDEDVRW